MTHSEKLAIAIDAILTAKRTVLEDGRKLIFVADVEKALDTLNHEFTDAELDVYEIVCKTVGATLNNRFNSMKLTITR